jgi:outer membrane murein-binding lipoprotein Lpp
VDDIGKAQTDIAELQPVVDQDTKDIQANKALIQAAQTDITNTDANVKNVTDQVQCSA